MAGGGGGGNGRTLKAQIDADYRRADTPHEALGCKSACPPAPRTASCVTIRYMSDSTAVRSIRLPADVLDSLSKVAAADHRSVNNLIIKALSDFVSQWPPGMPAAPARRCSQIARGQ